MLRDISRHWWLVLLRGVAAVILGLLAWSIPGITLEVVVLLFGAYAIVDGIMAIVHSFSQEGGQHRWSLLLMGLLGCLAGVITFGWPGITALALLFVIAFWAILTGVLEVVAAFGIAVSTGSRWLLGLAGVASAAFGVLLVVQPGTGLLTIVWLLGFYGVFYGILTIIGSFKLRNLAEETLEHFGGLTGAA
jgi:uncharacterized membrane protein HdeD (DUF308 family)